MKRCLFIEARLSSSDLEATVQHHVSQWELDFVVIQVTRSQTGPRTGLQSRLLNPGATEQIIVPDSPAEDPSPHTAGPLELGRFLVFCPPRARLSFLFNFFFQRT